MEMLLRASASRLGLALAATILATLVFAPRSLASPWTGLAANNQYPTDSLSTFDPVEATFGTDIPTTGDTVWVEPSPDGSTAYALTDFPGAYLDTIDIAAGTSTSVSLEQPYQWGAVSPDGRLLYLSEGGQVLPVEIGGEEPKPGTPIAVGGGTSDGVAFLPSGTTAYVANGTGVVPIDVATGKPGSEIATGAGTESVAVSPDGSTVWVANETAKTVTAVDVASGKTKSITVEGHPRDLAVSPDGSRVWVTLEEEHELTWIDTATDTAATPVETGGVVAEGIAASPDGKRVFVTAGAYDGSGRGTEIVPVNVESATPKVETAIEGFVDPVWDAITPDQAPVANFTVSSAPPGSATAFDASPSLPGSTPTVSYLWRFGDGSEATTSTPTASHVYTGAGTYAASVTETDAAGTSTALVYTGVQALREGTPAASATRSVVIAASQPQVSLSSYQLEFGSVGVHQPAPSKAITLTNTGQAPLHVGTVGLGGAQAPQFALSSDECQGATVAVGGSCGVTVSFHPSGGAASAQLAIDDDASGSPHTVLLSGTGLTSGTVSGHVSEAGGGPLAEAEVSVCTSATRAVCDAASTAADGSYTVTGLPSGSYSMEVYPTQSQLGDGAATVEVEQGQNVQQDFSLSAPTPLSHGVTFTSGGGTTESGEPTVRWDEPFSFQVPLTPPANGPANGFELLSITGWMTLNSGGAGNGGFGVAATERVLVAYNAQGHPEKAVGVEDEAGTADEPAVAAVTRAHAAKGGGGFGKAVEEGYKIGEKLQEVLKGSQDSEGNKVAEVKVPVGNGNVTETWYKHPKEGTEGAFTTVELPTPRGLCKKIPVPPPAKSGAEKGAKWIEEQTGTSKWFEERSNEASRKVQEGQRYVEEMPRRFEEWDQSNKRAMSEWWANHGAPGIERLFSPPTQSLAGPLPLESLFSAGALGGFGAREAAAEGSAAAPSMTSMLLYQGRPIGEGWPAGGLPVSSGTPLTVEFSVPSLQQRVHGEVDGGVESAASAVHIAGSPSAAAADDCENEERNNFNFNGYIDPSGHVVSKSGIPIAGATVSLLRAPSAHGHLSRVPHGSTVMSPANRRNPDRTDALGHFGWDVLNGFYRVLVSAAGCRPKTAGTAVFAVPPPVSNIVLRLNCPKLRRSSSRTSVKVRRRRPGEVTVIARVLSRGHHPDGYVTFLVGRRVLAQVALSRRGVAAATVLTTVSAGAIVATYTGDAFTKPSRGRG